MAIEENKEVSRRGLYFVNQHDFEGMAEVMAAPLLEGFRQGGANLLAAFPDYQGQHDEIIAEGNKVFTRFTATGTHLGELMGVQPTGKKVTITGVAVDTIVDSKIVENWIMFDWMSVLQQLGATSIPKP
jgi:predicted ester cyclase